MGLRQVSARRQPASEPSLRAAGGLSRRHRSRGVPRARQVRRDRDRERGMATHGSPGRGEDARTGPLAHRAALRARRETSGRPDASLALRQPSRTSGPRRMAGVRAAFGFREGHGSPELQLSRGGRVEHVLRELLRLQASVQPARRALHRRRVSLGHAVSRGGHGSRLRRPLHQGPIRRLPCSRERRLSRIRVLRRRQGFRLVSRICG